MSVPRIVRLAGAALLLAGFAQAQGIGEWTRIGGAARVPTVRKRGGATPTPPATPPGAAAPALHDYAGLDAHDKIVLVLTQERGEMDSTSVFDGSVNTPFAELRTKAINAREHGALGMLIVNGPREHAGEPLRRPHADGTGYMSSGL